MFDQSAIINMQTARTLEETYISNMMPTAMHSKQNSIR